MILLGRMRSGLTGPRPHGAPRWGGTPATALPSALLFLIAAFALFSGGCAGRNEFAREAYSAELNRWTRGVKVYEGFETRLYAYATYKSPSFREAYIERYSKSYSLDEEYKKVLLKRELEQAEEFNEFFFAAYTPEEKWNDFGSRDSVWKVYLEDSEGARLIPVSIKKIDASNPFVREFFPYFDLWSSGYIIRFPKYSEAGKEPVPGEKTEYIRLVVTGVLGKGELEWRLKE